MKRYPLFFLLTIANIILNANRQACDTKVILHEFKKKFDNIALENDSTNTTKRYATLVFNRTCRKDMLSSLDAIYYKDLLTDFDEVYYRDMSDIQDDMRKQLALCIANFAQEKTVRNYRKHAILHNKEIEKDFGIKEFKKAYNNAWEEIPGACSYLFKG